MAQEAPWLRLLNPVPLSSTGLQKPIHVAHSGQRKQPPLGRQIHQGLSAKVEQADDVAERSAALAIPQNKTKIRYGSHPGIFPSIKISRCCRFGNEHMFDMPPPEIVPAMAPGAENLNVRIANPGQVRLEGAVRTVTVADDNAHLPPNNVPQAPSDIVVETTNSSRPGKKYRCHPKPPPIAPAPARLREPSPRFFPAPEPSSRQSCRFPPTEPVSPGRKERCSIPEEFKELADKIKQLRPTKKIIYNVGQWFKNTETYELLVIVDIFGEFALLKINTLYGKYELIDNDEKTLEKLTDIINKEPHLKPIYIHIKEIEK